jgi:hypothetical protein
MSSAFSNAFRLEWSWGRDLNPRPRPYQGRAPPLSYPSGSRSGPRSTTTARRSFPLLSLLMGRFAGGKTGPFISRKIIAIGMPMSTLWRGKNIYFRIRHRPPDPPHARHGRKKLERGTGFEPATTSLEGWCSATELPPHVQPRGSNLSHKCGARLLSFAGVSPALRRRASRAARQLPSPAERRRPAGIWAAGSCRATPSPARVEVVGREGFEPPKA